MSNIKVGLKIRPLLPKEKTGGSSSRDIFESSVNRNQTSSSISSSQPSQQVSLKGQQYTFDQVFGSNYSQKQFYEETAYPLLKSYIDGYNVTIMAYGQTGSGKTFTMGTADDLASIPSSDDVSSADNNSSSNSFGLITRFVQDLFENMKDSSGQQQQAASIKVKVSFLEIYGEEIYDLIGFPKAAGGGNSSSVNCGTVYFEKSSLPVREDENGKVFVQGLYEAEVDSASEALSLLGSGSKNRVTASTAMNSGSSRSHAIYTITLEQHFKTSSLEEDKHAMTSKLTFVDLAGSERIKKTHADGQRLKEGIQINSGLFNLGQVINALADDQRLKQGIKSTHIPYRNSKLTHLLKDALGGNSQTWFIACVSPAEINEIETISTLTYARQARNIQNKPVKNMDPLQSEIRRLKYMVKAWMSKAIHLKFGASPRSSLDGDSVSLRGNMDEFDPLFQTSFTPSTPRNNILKVVGGGDEKSSDYDGSGWALSSSSSFFIQEKKETLSPLPSAFGTGKDALYDQPHVQEYISRVNGMIEANLQIAAPAPRKVRLSLGGGSGGGGGGGGGGNSSNNSNCSGGGGGGGCGVHTPVKGSSRGGKATSSTSKKTSQLQQQNQAAIGSSFVNKKTSLDSSNGSAQIEESEFKRGEDSSLMSGPGSLCQPSDHNGTSTAVIDISYTSDLQSESQQLVGRMLELMISEKEGVALWNDIDTSHFDEQISEKEDILKKLLSNVNSFSKIQQDFEKLMDTISSLEGEKVDLELELEKIKCHKTSNSVNSAAATERIKERYLKIKDELNKMKDEKKNKETAYMNAQRESRNCESLQKEIQKLKESKVDMMKIAKKQTSELNKIKKEQAILSMANKKTDFKFQKQVDTLRNELVIKDRVSAWKEKELTRLSAKLKACEEYISQLLAAQNRKQNNSYQARMSTTFISCNSSSNSNINSNTHSLHVELPLSDIDYFASAKGVLANYISERSDQSNLFVQYDAIARQIQDLNSTILSENNRLEALRLQANTLDCTSSSSSSLSSSSNISSNSESSEIMVLEEKIYELTHELDVMETDLELYYKSKQAMTGSEFNSAKGGEIVSDVISSLNIVQCRAMLVEYIDQYISTNEKLLRARDEIQRSNRILESKSSKMTELESDIHELKSKLNSQNVDRIWGFMKKKQESTSSKINSLDIDLGKEYGDIIDISRDVILDILGDADVCLDNDSCDLGSKGGQINKYNIDASNNKQKHLLAVAISKTKQLEAENESLKRDIAGFKCDSSAKVDLEEENTSLRNKLMYFYQGNVYNNIFKEFSSQEASDLTLKLWGDSKALIENVRLIGFDKYELQSRMHRSFHGLKTDVESIVSERTDLLRSMHQYYKRISKILDFKGGNMSGDYLLSSIVKIPEGGRSDLVSVSDVFDLDRGQNCTVTSRLAIAELLTKQLFQAYQTSKSQLWNIASDLASIMSQMDCTISKRSSLSEIVSLNKSNYLLHRSDNKSYDDISNRNFKEEGLDEEIEIRELMQMDASLVAYLYQNDIVLSCERLKTWNLELQRLRNIKIKKYEGIIEKSLRIKSLLKLLNIHDSKVFLKFFIGNNRNDEEENYFSSFIVRNRKDNDIRSRIVLLSDFNLQEDIQGGNFTDIDFALPDNLQEVFALFERLVFSCGHSGKYESGIAASNSFDDVSCHFICTVSNCCNVYLEVFMVLVINSLEEIKSIRLKDVEIVENFCVKLSRFLPHLIQVVETHVDPSTSNSTNSNSVDNSTITIVSDDGSGALPAPVCVFNLLEIKESCISTHRVCDMVRCLINLLIKNLPREIAVKKEEILSIFMDSSSSGELSGSSATLLSQRSTVSALLDTYISQTLSVMEKNVSPLSSLSENISAFVKAVDVLMQLHGKDRCGKQEFIASSAAYSLELHLSKVTPLIAVANEAELQAQMKHILFLNSCNSHNLQPLSLIGSSMKQLARVFDENIQISVDSDTAPILCIMKLLDSLEAQRGRICSVYETIKLLHKADLQFVKQNKDMQAFEASSKTDRTRLLLGNSKALVDEERVRKSNKKKYEQLVERISSLAQQLVASVTTGSNTGSNSSSISSYGINQQLPLLFLADLSFLSDLSQEILNGKIRKEKIELLHLHNLTLNSLQSNFSSTSASSSLSTSMSASSGGGNGGQLASHMQVVPQSPNASSSVNASKQSTLSSLGMTSKLPTWKEKEKERVFDINENYSIKGNSSVSASVKSKL